MSCLKGAKGWIAQVDTKVLWVHARKEMEVRFAELARARTIALHVAKRFLVAVFFEPVVSTFASEDFIGPFFQSNAASLKNRHARAVAHPVTFITV